MDNYILFIHSPVPKRETFGVSLFGYYETCYEHLCATLCVDISFYFSWGQMVFHYDHIILRSQQQCMFPEFWKLHFPGSPFPSRSMFVNRNYYFLDFFFLLAVLLQLVGS